MKKFLLIVLFVVGFSISALAQNTAQCKIAGASDGSTSTVSVESYNPETGAVTVGFYNDSEKQVTMIATVSSPDGTKRQIVANVPPQSSATKPTTVAENYTIDKIKVSISSAKCK